MSKLIQGIHHVALRCHGLAAFEKAISFYRDVLGLALARTWGEGDGSAAMVDTGDGIIEIFADGKADLPQGMLVHVALRTDDCDACVRAVEAAGYAVHVPAFETAINGTGEPCRMRIAFCHGPSGEEVEFFQQL